MENKKIKISINKFNTKEVIGLLIVVSLVSLVTGFAVANRILKDKYDETQISSKTNLDEFIKNYNYIVDNYYGQIDENKLLNSALEGLLEALDDPYTAYIDENEINNFDIKLEGTYQGLGIEVFTNSDQKIEIANVLENSPAEKSGFKSGDIIIKMDGEEISDSQIFTQKIQQKAMNNIVLTINREGEILNLKVAKGLITLDSVFEKVLENNGRKIGYLRVSIFANNTYAQMKESLEYLEGQNIDSLIIDVRSNTGGHLTSVEDILSLFLNNSHIIYKMENEDGITEVYSKGNQDFRLPIVILTNELSASASEILTAALKEELNAISVGQKTYGKGSAQELRTLPDGTKYKITTKKWLTPSGKSIDKFGIDADIIVEFDSSYYDNPVDANDTQLQAAISEITKR